MARGSQGADHAPILRIRASEHTLHRTYLRFRVRGAGRSRRARWVAPLRILRRDLRDHGRDRFVDRLAVSLELADSSLHGLEKRAVARDERRIADRAVAGNDLWPASDASSSSVASHVVRLDVLAAPRETAGSSPRRR